MDADELIIKTKDKLSKLPLPARPIDFGEEYKFPSDVTNLISVDLGSWLFKLSGWKGYVLRILAGKEIESSVLQDGYDASIMMNMALLSRDDKVKNKETATGKILNGSPEIKAVYDRLVVNNAEILALKRVLEIYTVQLEIVSREISRRSYDLKLNKEF
jgi:hypothetical protein